MYPRKMNRELAFRLLMAAGLKRAKVKDAAKMVRVGKWSNSLVRVGDRVDDDMPDLIEPPNLTEAAMIKDLDIKVTRANHARPVHEAVVDPPTPPPSAAEQPQ